MFKVSYFFLTFAFFHAGAQSFVPHKADRCRLLLADSARAEVILALADTTPRLDPLFELNALAAYLKAPFAPELLTAPASPGEAEVAGLTDQRTSAHLQSLRAHVENLREFMPENSTVVKVRLQTLSATLRSALASANAARARDNFLASGGDAEAVKRYFADLTMLLTARLKTHGDKLEEFIANIITQPEE